MFVLLTLTCGIFSQPAASSLAFVLICASTQLYYRHLVVLDMQKIDYCRQKLKQRQQTHYAEDPTLRRGQGSVFPMAMQAAWPAIATRHGSRLRCIEPTVTGKNWPSSAGPSSMLSPSFTVPERIVPPTTLPTPAIEYTSSICNINHTRIRQSINQSVSE